MLTTGAVVLVFVLVSAACAPHPASDRASAAAQKMDTSFFMEMTSFVMVWFPFLLLWPYHSLAP